MQYQFNDLFEIHQLQDAFDEFCKSISLPLRLIDNYGKVLIQSGINKCYHCQYPEDAITYIDCLSKILTDLNMEEPFKLYTCSERSNYAVFPIIIETKTIGYIIVGPFPIDSWQKSLISFLTLISKMLSSMIHENIKGKKFQATQEIIKEQLNIYTSFDSITSLPNRIQFLQRLDNEIEKCKAEDNKLALFLVDLDDFRRINDTFGYEYGDTVLRQAAEKLKYIIGERGMVCRSGGDEFAAFQTDIGDEAEALSVGEDIVKQFKKIIRINEHEMLSCASVGIVLYPNQGKEYKTLIKNADTALHVAKDNGKSQYQLYESIMRNEIKEKTIIEVELKKAIDEKQFLLHYQPLLDIKNKKITRVESLIRWKHPQYGLIPPSDFISVAEDNGLIIPIGEWVLKTACKQCKAWHDNGHYLSVAINMSAVQLQSDFFIERLSYILNETGLDPKYLELEITESEIIKRLDDNIGKLRELRNMGIKIALDDFGTGYSSLNYLYRLPINSLKIDKSFIDDICSDRRIEAIIDGIILLSKELKLDVTAEGVEKENQFKLLMNKGCDRIQGYFISKPLEVEKLGDFYIKHNRAV